MNSTSLIADANVLFSALISGKSIYKRLVNDFELYSIDFVFTELELHKEIILNKTKLDESQLLLYVISLFSGLRVLPSMILSIEARQKAYDLCKAIDLKDMPYVALSIQMNIPLVTNDKVLYQGLKKLKHHDIILLSDLIKSF